MSTPACAAAAVGSKTVEYSGLYIVKAKANQVEKITDMSIRAFETDVNVGGITSPMIPEDQYAAIVNSGV